MRCSDETHASTARTFAAVVALVSFAASVAGCIPGPDFEPESIVKGPRILAIVADKPDAAPGEDVVLDAYVVDPEHRALTYQWYLCVTMEQRMGGDGFSGAQYGVAEAQTTCDRASPRTLRLDGNASRVTLPGALTAAAFSQIETLRAAFGGQIPDALLRGIVERVGLPVSVQVDVMNGDSVLVRGFKRVLVRTGEPHGTNPPPPSVRVGEVDLAASETEAFRCVRDGATDAPVVVAPDERVVLSPAPGDDAWMETYAVLDPTGAIVEHRESAFYSWFATAGSFREGVSRAPARDDAWRAPKESGEVTMWMFVRDGHGGTSGCSFSLRVE